MAGTKSAQRGVVTLIVMFLLVAGVLFILTQSTEIVRNRGIDTAQDLDSSAALMLAESGMQRAQAVVSNNQTAGTFSESTCTGIATGAPFSVGRGTISYGTIAADPAGCTAGTCNTCTVAAIGTVGSTQRTLSAVFALGTVNGTTGRGKTVTMVLKNTYTVPAIALFDLAWRRQSHGGNANATLTPCVTCTIMWDLSSSSGNPSDGGMGLAVPIVAGPAFSETITQTLDKDRDYVEVGGLFPSASASTPTVVGSYWSNINTTPETAPNSGSSGGVKSGVVSGDATTCTTVSTTSGSSTSQACYHWCADADTLVFGLSGRSSSVAGETTAVQFNTAGTNGYSAQNVGLSRIVHYPNTDGSIGAASGQVYAEAWYARNRPYNATNNVTVASGANGVTSYTGAIVGVAGATLTLSGSGKINNNQNNGTVSAVSGTKICVGDTITDANLPSGTTITSLNGLSAAGTCQNPGSPLSVPIIVSQNATGNVTGPTVKTVSLQATSTTAALSAGSATVVTGGTTITIVSGPVSGVYTMAAAATIASGYIVQGNGLSSTIRAASANELPDTVGTTIAIYSASTGALPALTTVSSINAASQTFVVSAIPTTAILGARLCGGICALFNEPSSTTASTSFSITSSLTSQWSGGFMCLKGVQQDPTVTPIIPVSSSSITKRTWSEAIQ